MVQWNQIGKGLQDDHNAHLASFLKIYDTVKMNGVTDDATRLSFVFGLLEG